MTATRTNRPSRSSRRRSQARRERRRLLQWRRAFSLYARCHGNGCD